MRGIISLAFPLPALKQARFTITRVYIFPGYPLPYRQAANTFCTTSCTRSTPMKLQAGATAL